MAEFRAADTVKMKNHYSQKGVFELVEEAVHLLRRSALKLLIVYYIGTLPFTLGLLFFWTSMRHDAFAADQCAAAALGLTFLFFWMKSWQSVFTDGIKKRLIVEPGTPWTSRRALSTIATQIILQPAGLLFPLIAALGLNPSVGLAVVPFIILLMIPFAWCYAFFQNVTVLGVHDHPQIRNTVRDAWSQAKQWSGQNVLILLVFFLFGFFVFLNLNTVIYLIPMLLKMLFDVETRFSLSAAHLKNTTFFFITLNLTYLCLDPLLKTIYTLRCFYGKSMEDGEDLKADLKPFLALKKAGLLILMFFLVLGLSSPSHAAKKTDVAIRDGRNKKSAHAIAPSELDNHIQGVLAQKEFTWRMPREKRNLEEDQDNFIVKTMEAVNRFIKKTYQSVARAIKRFFKWLFKSDPKISPQSKPKNVAWVGSVHFFLYLIVAVLIGFGLYLGFRLWKNRAAKPAAEEEAGRTAQPDLNDEEVHAADLPADQWNQLADQLIRQGELRPALRALYLGILAHLGEKGLIRLAKYKSNRDYLRELRRREHAVQGLTEWFGGLVGIFDQVWYGMYAVALDDLKSFRSGYERIQSFVES